MALASRRPVLSAFTPLPTLNTSDRERHEAQLFYTLNPEEFTFPNNCSRNQFIDYYYTALLGLDQASTPDEVACARRAFKSFNLNYHFCGQTIKRSKPPRGDPRNPGTNANPSPPDPQAQLAQRCLRAARLLPYGGVANVSKALKTGDRIPLNADIICKLKACYPAASDDEITSFPPLPLPNFTVSRDAVARVIMSRNPSSHPGATGISFAALQNYCRWTYKAEEPDQPDHRWDLLCRLIAKIMSGNALILSDMLLDVVGAFFDKNAEKPDSTEIALRNLGIEESLLRVAATLVFEIALPLAIQGEFITAFDLGAGKKSGAEIFGRVAAMLSGCGAAVAVFDVVKAFNNLRRQDIKDAVEAFNQPLLTAFVHYLFSKDSKVTFNCSITNSTLVTWLTKGIHQGNPLSVFIFCLTIAHILKPFRAAHPTALVSTYVDDIELAMRRENLQDFPQTLSDFRALFARHGLLFDLADTAKSSVYTANPLPDDIRSHINALGFRCQTDGIAPCKIPCGTPAYMTAFANKLQAKLHIRFLAFQALWTALIKYDRSLKKPSNCYFEHYLNLIRLSFLSMPMYALRTLRPSVCVAYCRCSSEWALELIKKVLPTFIALPPSAPCDTPYPDLSEISQRIMQLPLTLGGLSFRLPSSIGDIAYSSSCTDCIAFLKVAALKTGVSFSPGSIPELLQSQRRIQALLPALNNHFWQQAADPLSELRREPLQHAVTALLNKREILSIAATLKPFPILSHAFLARTDARQDHVSWPINPKSRSYTQLSPLDNAQFSRYIGVAVLHPIMLPCTCVCGSSLDPVGLHFLHCKYTHFGFMHDRVKDAVGRRLRSFTNPDVSSLAVLIEQPVRNHYPLRNPSVPEGVTRVADLIVSLSGDVQQQPIVCDFVTTLAHARYPDDDFYHPLRSAALAKRAKYHPYDIPNNPPSFFPLPLGRTNVFSQEVFDFCELVDRHFPRHFRVNQKLRATFSRALCVGLSHTLNLAVRRFQMCVASRVALPLIPSSALLRPHPLVSRSRPVPRAIPFESSFPQLFNARLAAILTGSLADSSEPAEFLDEGRNEREPE